MSINVAPIPGDLIWSSGVLYVGSTPYGATDGPPKFTPNKTTDNFAFDGKYSKVKGLDRVMHGDAVISVTLIEIGNDAVGSGNQIAKIEPGATIALSGTSNNIETYTPQPSGGFIASASYLTDLRVIWERGFEGSATFFCVHFPIAICTQYEFVGRNKTNAQITATFESRISGSGSLLVPPYNLEFRTSVP